MKKFLLWFGIVIVVAVVTIWLRRTYIQLQIDKSIAAYGIPKSEITKTYFGYDFISSGYYHKQIWTKQDGQMKSYIFEYRHYKGDRRGKKVMLSFDVYGNEWSYHKAEADRQEFHDFLERNNWSLYYYPAPNLEADVYFE